MNHSLDTWWMDNGEKWNLDDHKTYINDICLVIEEMKFQYSIQIIEKPPQEKRCCLCPVCLDDKRMAFACPTIVKCIIKQ
jgi:hypothetical protein